MENQTEQLKEIVSSFNQNQTQGNNFSAPQVPQLNQQQVKYAGFWIRYAAAFLDGILVNIVSGVVGFILGIALGIAGKGDIASIIGGLTGYVLMWIYYIFMTNKYQATLGKMAVGVKVVNEDGSQVSLGKIILRETIGKILSMITLFIGYIVAGFHPKKKALHDQMAGTVVIYKDPNKKSNGWIIGIIIAVVVVLMVAIIGILASIVLVSLNSAREKASDAAVKSVITGSMVESVIYLDDNGSLKGFVPNISYPENIKKCSGDPIINISPNGQDIAVFAKLCSGGEKYFCDDINANATEVDVNYAQAGNAICPGSTPAQESINTTPTGIISSGAVDSNGLYQKVDEDIAGINVALEIAKKWQADSQLHAVFMLSSGELANEHAFIFKSKSKPGKMFSIYLSNDGKTNTSEESQDEFPEMGYVDYQNLKISSAKAYQASEDFVKGKLKSSEGDYQKVFILSYIAEAKDNVWMYTLINKKSEKDVVHVFVTGTTGDLRSDIK